MNRMSEVLPHVVAEVTFLSTADGGRTTLPLAPLLHCRYMPHAVVEGTDEYLGIQFIDGPSAQFGIPDEFRLALMYYPRVDYSKLTTGTVFSIKEGKKTVAIGKVLSRSDA